MKKYVKSSKLVNASKSLDMKLPSLEAAFKEAENSEYSLFDDCDFRYRVEDDGVEGTVLIWVADYNEYIGSSEFYEYEFVDNLFKKFEKAIQKDTGDSEFILEPYDSVEFCGRAWVNRNR